MALVTDRILIVWEAMNLLNEVRTPSDPPEVSTMLAQSERMLLDLLSTLLTQCSGGRNHIRLIWSSSHADRQFD